MTELGSEQNILPPKRWKKRWTVALLGIVCLELYQGKGKHFIHASWWDSCLFYLSLAFALWTVITFFRKDYASKLNPNISALSKQLFAFSLLPLFSAFFFWNFFTNVTDIATRIIGTPFSISALHFKEGTRSGRTGRNACYTISTEDCLRLKLPCSIAIDFHPWSYYTYDSLPDPIPVVLDGAKSIFGFHFQNVTRQS